MASDDPPETVGKEGDRPPLLYRWHLRGAVVRSSASLIMWLCCLAAYLLDFIRFQNFISDTLAVAYLILMNPPALWVLKRIKNRKAADRFGVFINFLEIVGYTAVIYSFGGIEASFLLPIYAALITYVGIMGPQVLPFVNAGLCSLAFGVMLTLEYLGVLPPMKINPNYHISWTEQLAILAVTTVLLFIVAFIASYTARLLKRNRDKLYRQNRELELTAIKARESDRLKSEFLANVSHEFRTPLNAIIGFSELLRDECLGTLNDRQREAVSDISSSGTHLLSLINDLLDLSKVEVGKMELHLSEIRLKSFLEQSLSAFGQRIRESGLKVSADLADCPEVIRADERKLTQVLYNLLSNAVKFTPAGGGIGLSARSYARKEGRWVTKNGEIADLPIGPGGEGMDHAGLVEVCVSDTGIGLKGEDLKRIFNPFEQVDGSLSRRYQGTGLGLSLSKRFVELHHGQIWAESGGENHGSAFHFVIPL